MFSHPNPAPIPSITGSLLTNYGNSVRAAAVIPNYHERAWSMHASLRYLIVCLGLLLVGG